MTSHTYFRIPNLNHIMEPNETNTLLSYFAVHFPHSILIHIHIHEDKKEKKKQRAIASAVHGLNVYVSKRTIFSLWTTVINLSSAGQDLRLHFIVIFLSIVVSSGTMSTKTKIYYSSINIFIIHSYSYLFVLNVQFHIQYSIVYHRSMFDECTVTALNDFYYCFVYHRPVDCFHNAYDGTCSILYTYSALNYSVAAHLRKRNDFIIYVFLCLPFLYFDSLLYALCCAYGMLCSMCLSIILFIGVSGQSLSLRANWLNIIQLTVCTW